MNKIQLDNFKKWFDDYVQTFYIDRDQFLNANINLKLEHTWRVCEEAAWLAKQLGLTQNDCLLAETAALFHDIGRFPQFAKYRTYSDLRSINHAQFSVEIMAQNDILCDLDKTSADIIETAVRLHGTKKLPDGLEKTTDLIAKILRDADKLDVYHVVISNYKLYLAKPENCPIEIEFPYTGKYSQHMIDAILAEEHIDYCMIKTLDDAKLLQLAWLFDINFPQTFQKIKQNRFLHQIVDFLPKDPQIEKVVKFIFNYLEKRITAS